MHYFEIMRLCSNTPNMRHVGYTRDIVRGIGGRGGGADTAVPTRLEHFTVSTSYYKYNNGSNYTIMAVIGTLIVFIKSSLFLLTS